MAVTVLKRWVVPVGSVKYTPIAAAAGVEPVETFEILDGLGTTATSTYSAANPNGGVLYCEYILVSKDTETTTSAIKTDLSNPLYALLYPVAINNNTDEQAVVAAAKNAVAIETTKVLTITAMVAGTKKFLIEVWGF